MYGEIVDKIIVYDDYMLVKLKYLDFAFKIKYSTHGYMEKYTTVIESCEIVNNSWNSAVMVGKTTLQHCFLWF